jgi:hypothetical protein
MKDADAEQFIPLAALCIMVIPTTIGIWLIFDIRFLPALVIAAACIMPIQILEPTLKRYAKKFNVDLFTTLHWWFCILLTLLCILLSPIFLAVRLLD